MAASPSSSLSVDVRALDNLRRDARTYGTVRAVDITPLHSSSDGIETWPIFPISYKLIFGSKTV